MPIFAKYKTATKPTKYKSSNTKIPQHRIKLTD